jgi:hypothetical protein
MTDSIHTTELAFDAEIAEIRALAGSRSVMHWPGILRIINRLETAERERDEARAAALEEAAKVAETQRRKVLFIRSGCHPTADHDDYERLTYAADHLEDAAAAIRALKETSHD